MTQDDLKELKNIGPKMVDWLHEIGVHSRAELERLGTVEAYRRLKALHPDRVTVLALYALEGALTDTHWNAIPPEIKQALREEVEASEHD